MIKKLFLSLLLCSTAFGQFWNMPDQKPWLGKQIDRSHPLSHGLVGCWLMNEGLGNKVYDLSGNKNTGTFVADTYFTSGKFGPVINFDGIGDIVNCGSFPQVGNLLEFTVSFWMKVPTDTIAITQFMLSKRGGIDADRTFAFYINTSENVYFNVFTQTPDDALCWYTDAFLNVANVWKHVTGVYDGTNINIYVNGVVGTGAALSGITNDNSTALVMGAENTSAQNAWTGQLDNVKVWNRALTASEVLQDYREPFCMFEPVFPVWWYGGIGAPPAGGQVIMIMGN